MRHGGREPRGLTLNVRVFIRQAGAVHIPTTATFVGGVGCAIGRQLCASWHTGEQSASTNALIPLQFQHTAMRDHATFVL